MAWFEHGDIMAEDPTCFFEPEDESTISEHEAETNRNFKRYAFMARYAARQRSEESEQTSATSLLETLGEEEEPETDPKPASAGRE